MTDYEKKINELKSKGLEFDTFETTDDGFCINVYHVHTSYTEYVYDKDQKFINKIEHV